MNLCLCGCGKIVKSGREFIRWHHNKIRAKCGEKHHFWGKHHSKETRLKMSLAKRDFVPWNKGKGKKLSLPINCLCGCNCETNPGKKYIHGHSGRNREQHVQNRITTSVKRRWKNKEFRSKMKCIMNKTKNKISKSIKLLWETGDYRKRVLETKIKNNSNEKNSIKMKENWKDPIYRIRHIGSRAANWRGGLSYEKYSPLFTNKLKDEIKKLDKYKCRNPQCNNVSKVLTIHHMDYNKRNNKKDNLITLCKSCNSRANGDRIYWYNFYFPLINYGINVNSY